MRFPVVAATLALAFAGCTSSPQDEPSASASSSSSPSVLVFAEPPPTTDRLYLLDPPHMAGTLPEGAMEHRTPLVSGLDGDDSTAWTMPRPELGSLVAEASIWVDVRGTHAHPPVTPGGCFWYAMLRIHHDSGWSGWLSDCPAQEDPVVAQGVREVRFTFPVIDATGVEGDRVSLWVTAGSGTKDPGATVEVLSGTAEHPSWLAIQGMQLPLDTQTYL